jgi:hypothetical protein
LNSNNIKTYHLVYLLVLWVFHATLHLSSKENFKSSMFDTFWTFDFIPSTIKVEIFSFLLFSIENFKIYPMCIVVKQNWYSIIQIWHLIWTSKNDHAKMYDIAFDKQMHHFMCVNGFKWRKNVWGNSLQIWIYHANLIDQNHFTCVINPSNLYHIFW